tara:strand:+ start:252 stop:1037 length:786 start_codon:yes stop_codon:yes gene_type:complete
MTDIIRVKIKELNYNKKLPLEYELSNKSGGRKKNGLWGKISNILLFLFGIRVLNYNWEKLEKSLIEEGYDTSKYGYIEVHKKKEGIWSAGPGKFSVLNGNHRVFLLQKLYGNEHEIEVRTNKNGISMIIKNVKESLDTRTTQPKTTTKEKIKKLLVWCKLLIPTVYMFGFHFVDTLLLFTTLVLSQSVLKSTKDLKTFDTLNNKWLDVVWRNLYYNHKMIVGVLLLLIYVLHLIIGDFTGFTLMLILYFVVEWILQKTHNI